MSVALERSFAALLSPSWTPLLPRHPIVRSHALRAAARRLIDTCAAAVSGADVDLDVVFETTTEIETGRCRDADVLVSLEGAAWWLACAAREAGVAATADGEVTLGQAHERCLEIDAALERVRAATDGVRARISVSTF